MFCASTTDSSRTIDLHFTTLLIVLALEAGHKNAYPTDRCKTTTRFKIFFQNINEKYAITPNDIIMV